MFADKYKQSNIYNTLARPIKETPILYGEDARRFEERMREHRHISAEEKARINEIYEALIATANF